MVFTKPLIVAALSVVSVNALNDWSKPCFGGSCSYDLPDAATTQSGSMKIWSASTVAITDVTEAAGWLIIGCDAGKIAQDIRLVCKVPGDAGCAHLYQQGSAVGKLVRLPESCGKGPFARVASQWDPEDQTIPAKFAKRIVKRDGESPKVRALALDTNFGLTDPTKWGEVNLAIVGANFQGAKSDIDTSDTKISKRGFFDKIGGFVKKTIDKISDLNKFDKDLTKKLPPVNINKDLNLFNDSIACTAGPASFDASVSVDTSAKINAQAEIGVTAAGTIIPPKLKDFAIFAGLNAEINGELAITASASASVSSGDLTLATIGVPGLSFPGILTIGPSLSVKANALATLDVDLDLSVTLAYSIKDAKFFFPQSGKNKNVGSFNPLDTPLKLALAGNVQARGTIEAHIIPRLDFGINALGGLAKATVFLDLDASAALTLTLDGNVAAAAEIGGKVEASASAEGIEASPAPEVEAEASAVADAESAADAEPTDVAAEGDVDVPVAKGAKGDVASKAAEKDIITAAPSKASAVASAKAEAMKSVKVKATKSAKAPKSSVKAEKSKSVKAATKTVAVKSTASAKAKKTATSVKAKATAVGSKAVAAPAKATAEVWARSSRAAAVAIAKRQTKGFRVTQPLTASISGCLDLTAKLQATLGAEGSLFGIFDKEVNKVLFSKEFELFKKCFGKTKRTTTSAIEARSSLTRRALVCPAKAPAALDAVVNESVTPA